MGRKLENAKGLYLEGIRDGDIEAVNRYSGDRYTQHSTGVADGAQGFIDFFQGFLRRTTTRDIRIVRAIEDGDFVFVHVYQDIDDGVAKWVTTDLFDTDEQDKLVEHWDVIAAYRAPADTVSGNDMVLGEFEIRDPDKTEQNKALIRSFLVEVFQNGHHEAVERFVSTEKYVEHNPGRPDGIDALKQSLAARERSYDFVFKAIGQGDHVVSYSKVKADGTELAVFDLFRIEKGKIVEHWDNMEPIPPRTEWANSGKF